MSFSLSAQQRPCAYIPDLVQVRRIRSLLVEHYVSKPCHVLDEGKELVEIDIPSADPSSLSLSCSMSSSLDMPDMKSSSSESIGLAVVSGVGGPSFSLTAEAILLLDLVEDELSEDTIASAAFRFLD